MNKFWFILPLMLGCNSPDVGVADASVGNSDASVSDASSSGSNNVGLGAAISEAGNPASAGVSCAIPVGKSRYYYPGAVHRFHHRRRHHHCQ
jgi:hypothetical protein